MTRDAWLKALSEAQIDTADDRDAVTYQDFVEMFGGSVTRAARALKALEAQGKVQRTRKRNEAGFPCIAFRLVEQACRPRKRASR